MFEFQAAIRKELNEYKSNEMEVHASSKHLTRSDFCVCDVHGTYHVSVKRKQRPGSACPGSEFSVSAESWGDTQTHPRHSRGSPPACGAVGAEQRSRARGGRGSRPSKRIGLRAMTVTCLSVACAPVVSRPLRYGTPPPDCADRRPPSAFRSLVPGTPHPTVPTGGHPALPFARSYLSSIYVRIFNTSCGFPQTQISESLRHSRHHARR